ncbi:MAG: 30S ribosomal protein S17 [Pirellulales bacterium]|nr:30S ribosomal protein S17 [Pirellulales bacterium]
MPKKQLIGIVTSDKMKKTRRVEVPRLVKHPKYGKYIRQRTVCHVHDEGNRSKLGDTVEIVECPPKSKQKRWELVRIVTEGRFVDLVAMRAVSKSDADSDADPTRQLPAGPDRETMDAPAEQTTETTAAETGNREGEA